jgi:hypothetical protein
MAFMMAARAYQKVQKADTKLSYAIAKVLPRAIECIKAFNEEREDIEVEHANVDANGSLLFIISDKGQKVYQFTKDDQKVVNKKLRTLESADRDIKVHIVKDLEGEVISNDLIPHLQGFVIEGETQKESAD